jgi:hypothetical protein
MKKFLVIIFLIPCLGLLACGSEEEGQPTTAESAPSSSSSTTWPRLERAAEPYAERLLIPRGPSPKRVVIKDLKEGKGQQIRPGYWFTISYIALGYPTREFLEDKTGANIWYWKWGDGALTEGWEIGLKGLRVGGVRELIVPSRLAYGTGTVVYVLKLKKLYRTQVSTDQL